MHPANPTVPDLAEKGAVRDGQPRSSDRRLFMQLLAFGQCRDAAPLVASAQAAGVTGVVYADLADARGVGLLAIHQEPAWFVGPLRRMLLAEPWAALAPKPEFTMFGRTYSLGYEPDLEETLIRRPLRTALNPAWSWAVWYPIRRAGRFSQLPADEQRQMLTEHGQIGMAFGRADLGHDIRLASFGLDRNDSDFTVGLVGKDLLPLSKLVEAMRKTQQTALYLERLGPFFVGQALWKSPPPAPAAQLA